MNKIRTLYSSMSKVEVDEWIKDEFSLPTVNSFKSSISCLIKSYGGIRYSLKTKKIATNAVFDFRNFKAADHSIEVVSHNRWISSIDFSSSRKESKETLRQTATISDLFCSILVGLWLVPRVVLSGRVATRSAVWKWAHFSLNFLCVYRLLKQGNFVLWSNLDQPDANPILGLSDKVIGLHGPAVIEAHCARRNPRSVIFHYRWQEHEARCLPGYHLPDNTGVIASPVTGFGGSPEDTVYLVSSGYWLREELDMLFEHETKGYSEIEIWLLRNATKLKCLFGADAVKVLPHPRELSHYELAIRFYAQFDVELDPRSLDDYIRGQRRPKAIVGGTSTSFSRFGDMPGVENRVFMVVPDCWQSRCALETPLGGIILTWSEAARKFKCDMKTH